jgi:hypothetical protein
MPNESFTSPSGRCMTALYASLSLSPSRRLRTNTSARAVHGRTQVAHVAAKHLLYGDLIEPRQRARDLIDGLLARLACLGHYPSPFLVIASSTAWSSM